MSETRIREVRSRADRRAYLALTAKPYAANPYWVYPDVRILRGLLRNTALLAGRCEWRALLAEEDHEPVACMTAFLHRSFEEKLGRRIGTIGFFEALPDHPLAVGELFGEAERWLASRGATRIWGPMNGHILYGFGCLDDQFSERPVLGTAYNLPEAAAHWWRRHYQQAPSFYSYRIDLTRADTRAAVDAALANSRLEQAPRISIRKADLAAWRREVEIFVDVHNEAFAENWASTPLSHAEIWELMGIARRGVDPELFWIAEIEGRPIGLVLALPDLNEAFARIRGEPVGLKGALALLRFGRRIRKGALYVVAVLREARGRGLGATLTAHAMNRMIARGMTEMEYCLVLESNVASRQIARQFGGEQSKSYRMFEKVLAGTALPTPRNP
jgi:ribosomal protein S18 acetylase RimI-like enzyme